jgi:AAA15 family ATPase/GTPase
MTNQKPRRISVPRIESLRVKNYRALRDTELRNITPLTVFLGPNGSGKTTICDVFAFLSECFSVGLEKDDQPGLIPTLVEKFKFLTV